MSILTAFFSVSALLAGVGGLYAGIAQRELLGGRDLEFFLVSGVQIVVALFATVCCFGLYRGHAWARNALVVVWLGMLLLSFWYAVFWATMLFEAFAILSAGALPAGILAYLLLRVELVRSGGEGRADASGDR